MRLALGQHPVGCLCRAGLTWRFYGRRWCSNLAHACKAWSLADGVEDHSLWVCETVAILHHLIRCGNFTAKILRLVLAITRTLVVQLYGHGWRSGLSCIIGLLLDLTDIGTVASLLACFCKCFHMVRGYILCTMSCWVGDFLALFVDARVAFLVRSLHQVGQLAIVFLQLQCCRLAR